MSAMKIDGFMPSDSSRVCSDHFRLDDFDTASDRKIVRLKASAIPSVLTGQESSKQAVGNYSLLEKVQESSMTTQSTVVSQNYQLPKSLQEESDIKLAKSIMDHLGLSENISFDVLANESQVAVGSRLELILGIVANGALVPLVNNILNDSDVEDLVSMKGMLVSNSDTCEKSPSIKKELMEDTPPTEDGHSSFKSLARESVLKFGRTPTGQMSNTASHNFINLDYEDDLIGTWKMPYSKSQQPTSPPINVSNLSESTVNYNGDSMRTQTETMNCSQGQMPKDTSDKTNANKTAKTRRQKSLRTPKRQSLRLKTKEHCSDIILDQIHTENDDIEDNKPTPSTSRGEEEECPKPSCNFRGLGDTVRKHYSVKHKDGTTYRSAKRDNVASSFPSCCPICDLRFKNRTLLYFHKTRMHCDKETVTVARITKTEADIEECPSCAYTGLDSALRKHYSRQHQKQENKSFHEAKREWASKSDPSALPFPCNICSLKYRTYNSLYVHTTRAHKTEMEKKRLKKK